MMKINYKNQFFLNWLLLLPFGLWPDKETKFTYLQATLFCCLMMSSIIFQLSRLFTAECSFDLIVRILSSTTFFATLTVPTILFWIHSKTMKYLLYKVEHMYDELHDRNEITICEKYRYIARRFTIIVVILLMCAMTFATVLLYWPFAFDILIPKNESYTIRTMEIVSKFFVVSKKYYFLVMVHLCSAASAGVIVLSAIGTMLISHFMHACGMFEIASYRIEQAMAVELLHIFNIRNEIIIYRKIICAIDIQRQAMDNPFVDLLLNLFKITKVYIFKGMLHRSEQMKIRMCNVVSICRVKLPIRVLTIFACLPKQYVAEHYEANYFASFTRLLVVGFGPMLASICIIVVYNDQL
ncbi:uncharacterized protein LOC105282612 isoform X5 [Ooceraea biroi]|uniref:uncharacterized protein LOC105282612 isoform X5 n=1 Tax=Ooceraea biroi TaxID=2015173 RepID=UPI0005BB694E|nr:uncharacterized protein LOC105282612 isoform X5 [Ooceraea biroi]